MKVLVKGFSNNRVGVYRDSHLLEHCIDVSIVFLLSSFRHRNQHSSALFDILPNVLKLLGIERHAGTSKEQEIALLECLVRKIGFVDITLKF